MARRMFWPSAIMRVNVGVVSVVGAAATFWRDRGGPVIVRFAVDRVLLGVSTSTSMDARVVVQYV